MLVLLVPFQAYSEPMRVFASVVPIQTFVEKNRNVAYIITEDEEGTDAK